MLSATYFDTRYTNLIAYDFSVFPGTVQNIDKARTQGVEVSGRFSLPGAIEIRLAYTYLEADDLSAGERLLRRPRHSGSVDLWHDFGHGFSAGVGLVFSDDKMDVDAVSFATIQGENYTVVRVYGAWQATPRVALKARIENLFDEDYAQVNGYPQLGLGAYAGIEVKF